MQAASDLSSIYVRKASYSFTGQLFDCVCHGAMMPCSHLRSVEDLERLQDVVNQVWFALALAFAFVFSFEASKLI